MHHRAQLSLCCRVPKELLEACHGERVAVEAEVAEASAASQHRESGQQLGVSKLALGQLEVQQCGRCCLQQTLEGFQLAARQVVAT